MLRQSLLFLSQSAAAQRLVSGTGIARHMAERFVAGETLDEAIAAVRACKEIGLRASLDYLGESVTTPEEAEAAVEATIASLERLVAEGVEANVSIKLTQFGLDIDEALCRRNLERVLDRARELEDEGNEVFVRIDMESSEYTERTIALLESLWEAGYRTVGTVLQSYLRRTPDDVERLNRLGARVRLVKGAYGEPATVAFPDKEEVDAKFVEEMKALLEHGNYPAIATQDEAMIAATRNWAFERGIPKSAFEFQMLYGVRRDLQRRLLEEGYRVRVYIPYGGSWYPYLMRRMAERPANVLFITGNLLKESRSTGWATKPAAVGAGVLAGALSALAWRGRRNGRRNER